MTVPGGPTRRRPRTSLIGRSRELDALRSAVVDAAEGSPAAVLLTGLPGMGKTRLAHEALKQAAESGFSTYAGRAQELSGDLAYAPLVTALGPTLREYDASRLAAIVGDLPQLGLLFSGLGLATPSPLGDPALEQARVVDGLGRLVERLARERPLALLVDDAHAVDASTRVFIDQLVDVVTSHPVLLVLTARPDDPGEERVAGLTRTLSGSAWSMTEVPVREMNADEGAALIAEVVGAPADPALSTQIMERCAGRPLFIEAVARTLVESGQARIREGRLQADVGRLPLPEAVRDQLRIRLARVGPEEREVLHVLAVAEGALDFASLDRVLELTPERTTTVLERLHGRALLGNGSVTRPYDLAHGLLRETLLEELSPTRIASLHARLARALLSADAEDPRVAEHLTLCVGMVEPQLALEPLLAGADHARRMGATADTVRCLGAAIAAATGLGRDELVASLRRDLGTALRQTGDVAGAREAWVRAVDTYRELGDTAGVAAVEQELGMLAWSAGELDEARGRFAAAAEALAGLQPSLAHATLLFGRVVTGSRTGDTEAVSEAVRELHQLSGRLGSTPLSAQVLLAEAVLDYAATDYVAMTDKCRRGLAAAERAGDRLLELRANDQLSVAYASQFDLTGLRATSEASLRIADDLASPLLGGWPRGRLAVADLLAGDWDSALRRTTQMCDLVRRFEERRGAVSGYAMHAWVLVHRGRLADAQWWLDEAESRATPMLVTDRNIFTFLAIATTSLALARGEVDRALQHADRLQEMQAGWMPILAMGVLGEARVAAGDVDGALVIACRLEGVRSCATGAHLAVAQWVRGLAARRAIQGDGALGHLDRAAALFDGLGLPFYAARAGLDAAAVLVGTDSAEAVVRGKSALEIFDRVGAPLQAQAARNLLRELGVVPSRGRRSRRGDSPLSPRELEVARLVAAGMTNAEVATELFLSPRTVTTHLDRIYSRLGLSSRVALTRYLLDSGLLDQAVT